MALHSRKSPTDLTTCWPNYYASDSEMGGANGSLWTGQSGRPPSAAKLAERWNHIFEDRGDLLSPFHCPYPNRPIIC